MYTYFDVGANTGIDSLPIASSKSDGMGRMEV